MRHGWRKILMFKKRWSLLLLSSMVSGCMWSSSDPMVAQAYASTGERLLPIKKTPSAFLQVEEDPLLKKAYLHYLRTGKAPNILTQGFIRVAYSANAQPIVQTLPFQETVISLKPGEHFTNVSSGDPARWSYDVAESGQGDSVQQHVLVKPSMPNISTNLVITTDQHLYNLRLVSSATGGLTRNVSFWYPDELRKTAEAAKAAAEKTAQETALGPVDMTQLNFHYHISNGGFFHSPRWRPLRVFDNGQQTVIQFPDTISSSALPALFLSDGAHDLVVNYRYRAPYMVVDRLFHEAVLVSGVGTHQTRVYITHLAKS